MSFKHDWGTRGPKEYVFTKRARFVIEANTRNHTLLRRCAAASALHPQLKQVSTTLRPRPTCIAPMGNYWSQLCTAQLNRPLPQLLQALYGSGIFAVSAYTPWFAFSARARAA